MVYVNQRVSVSFDWIALQRANHKAPRLIKRQNSLKIHPRKGIRPITAMVTIPKTNGQTNADN